MNRMATVVAPIAAVLVALVPPLAHASFVVVWGTSWDGVSLQDVLDAEYGVGTINAGTDYIGFKPGDADPFYWQDAGVHGLVIRELASYREANVFGWYQETFARPVIDGVDDGAIFSSRLIKGATAYVTFPSGVTRFGFYLNPDGQAHSRDATGSEMFFTNRHYNDIGPDGSAALHGPIDGDPQCLVYNITRLRDGIPTFVLAWEDLDYGSAISDVPAWGATDDDFQDLVVEVSAASPLPSQQSSWGRVKSLFGPGE
jgi:hypothetical protein